MRYRKSFENLRPQAEGLGHRTANLATEGLSGMGERLRDWSHVSKLGSICRAGGRRVAPRAGRRWEDGDQAQDFGAADKAAFYLDKHMRYPRRGL